MAFLLAKAAVVERTETATETGADPQGDTGGQDEESTATDASDSSVQTGVSTDTEDSIAKAIKDGDEADRKAEIRAEAEKLREEERAAAAQKTAEDEFNTLWTDFGKDREAALSAEGFTPEQIQALLWNPLNAKKQEGSEPFAKVARAELSEAYAKSQHADDLEEFLKRVDKKPLAEWQAVDRTLYAERHALETDAVKKAPPADLVKANGDLRRYIEGLQKEARDLGRGDPAGDATGEAVKRAAASTSYKNEAEMRAAHARGEITNATARAWLAAR